MIELRDDSDWRWYKKGIDLQHRTEFTHDENPTEYPCIVETQIHDQEYAYGSLSHTFHYKVREQCSECGYVSLKYPNVSDQ